jgi:hypothetical protein
VKEWKLILKEMATCGSYGKYSVISDQAPPFVNDLIN